MQTIDHLIIKVGPTETEAVKMFENLKTSISTISKIGKNIEQKIQNTCGLKLSLSQGGDRGTPKCIYRICL